MTRIASTLAFSTLALFAATALQAAGDYRSDTWNNPGGAYEPRDTGEFAAIEEEASPRAYDRYPGRSGAYDTTDDLGTFGSGLPDVYGAFGDNADIDWITR